MNRYDAVLFDFDGTIVDTGEGIIKSLVYALESMGNKVPSYEKLRTFIGPPIYESFTNDYGATDENVHEYIRKYRERYLVKGIYESCLYNGIEELLHKLKENGVLTGIASSKPEKMIYQVMDHLGITSLFDCIFGASLDETVHTTKAQLITMGMQNLGITDKSRVLMVGDRSYDLDGANEVGVDCAGMLYGYGSREELEAHHATFVFETAQELQAFLLDSHEL